MFFKNATEMLQACYINTRSSWLPVHAGVDELRDVIDTAHHLVSLLRRKPIPPGLHELIWVPAHAKAPQCRRTVGSGVEDGLEESRVRVEGGEDGGDGEEFHFFDFLKFLKF